MTGYHLIGIGLVLILTPGIMAVMDGALDDGDMIHWLASKPLQFILAFRAMVIAGVWLIGTGALFLNLPA